jgi:hypothetical protein
MANQIVNGKFLNNDTFSPFQSSGGIVHSCNNYYSLVQKAGGKNLEQNNMGITYETAFGGKGKKTKKTKKSSSSSKTKKTKKATKTKKPTKSILNKTMNGVKKIKNMIMSKVSSMKKKKPKKQKGGQESSGATPMDMRFFDTKANLLSSSADSGMGVNSAYGIIDPKDIGSGMLAPYTTSTSKTANYSSGQQTGGKKSKGKVKKTKSKKEKSVLNKIMKKMSNIKKSILPGDKKKKSGKKSKKQRGGESIDILGYDSSDKYAPVDNLPQKGGKDLMKKMSSEPIIKSQNLTTGIIDGAVNILNGITKGYNKSIKETENIKIGNQRLIKGGKKPTKSSPKKKPKKSAPKKKPKKSVPKKKPKKSVPKKKPKKHKGGDGSDFALTLASRGPANAPDKFWGVDGETWFRQFNKTGQYIPNSRLAEAATPLLLSGPNNNIVMGYDDMGIGSPYGKP